jgi:hypothetical protein
MSLNFVSKSVLTSKDGVSHDTETDLEPTTSSGPTTYVKPLSEQLRQNAQEAQEKYDEMTKSMRGAKTLDAEDVAFIESLEQRKLQMMHSVKKQEEEELNIFRAAKIEKSMVSSTLEEEEMDQLPLTKEIPIKTSSASHSVKPPIIIKKRRRKQPENSKSTNSDTHEPESRNKKIKKDGNDYAKRVDERKQVDDELQEVSKEKPNALGALLAYGSDSESD